MIDKALIVQLMEYQELEEDEHGEAMSHLLSIPRYDYCFSDDFLEAVEREMYSKLEYYKENCEIVEEKETSIYTFKRLEWKN